MAQNNQSSRAEPPAWLNAISRNVIECAIAVHRVLGPGLAERLYEEAMMIEFAAQGLRAERQVPVTMTYRGTALPLQRLDLVVERLIVVELKAVESVLDVHVAQLLSYLRAARLPLGLVINFNVLRLVDGVRRRVNSPALVELSPLPSARSEDPPEFCPAPTPLSPPSG